MGSRATRITNGAYLGPRHVQNKDFNCQATMLGPYVQFNSIMMLPTILLPLFAPFNFYNDILSIYNHKLSMHSVKNEQSEDKDYEQ